MSDAIDLGSNIDLQTWVVPRPTATARFQRTFNLGADEGYRVELKFFSPIFDLQDTWVAASLRDIMQISRPNDESGYILTVDSLLPGLLTNPFVIETYYYTVIKRSSQGTMPIEVGQFKREA